MIATWLLLTTLASVTGMPQIELIDAGKTPRHRVRYQLPEGVFTAQLDWQVGAVVLRGNLQGEEFNAPLLSAVLELELRRRTDRRMSLRVLIRAAKVIAHHQTSRQEPSIDYDAALSNCYGMTWYGTVDNRGRVTWQLPPVGLDVATNRVLEEMGRALASQLTIPVPHQAIGKGARWRAQTAAKVGFVPNLIEQKTYALDSFDGESLGVTYQVALTHTGKPIDLGSAFVDITDTQTTGTGHGNHQLDTIFPSLADHTFETWVTLTPSQSTKSPGRAAKTDASDQSAFVAVFKTREILRNLGPQLLGP